MQDVIHQPDEGCRSIHQPKRHAQPFKSELLGFEGNIPHIRGFDWYLVIPEIQFNIAKTFGPLELVLKVINLWDQISIIDIDLFQHSIVNTESPSPTVLLHQHDWAATGR